MGNHISDGKPVASSHIQWEHQLHQVRSISLVIPHADILYRLTPIVRVTLSKMNTDDTQEIRAALSLHWKTIQEMSKKMECFEEDFKQMKTLKALELKMKVNEINSTQADLHQKNDRQREVHSEPTVKSEMKKECTDTN